MRGLVFEPATRATAVIPARNDVACFIGFCAPRADAEAPAALRAWLVAEGWWAEAGTTALRPGSLLDVPLPIEDWETFDRLFAWDRRPFGRLGGGTVSGATRLGAAVRSFFAQGGKKCWVVALGEPVDHGGDRASRDAAIARLLPVYAGQRGHREQWHGLHHLFGLAEAAFVALPDLVELAAEPVPVARPAVEPPVPEPGFTACSRPVEPPAPDALVLQVDAPRCGEAGFGIWATALRRALRWLADWRRDMQLLAAVPLGQDGTVDGDLLGFMHRRGWLRADLDASASLASPQLQLVHPWLQMDYAGDLPAGLEAGEGALAGVLARNALLRGTYRDAAAQPLRGLRNLQPRLSRAARLAPSPQAPSNASPGVPLAARVSLLAQTVNGYALASDVTTSNDPLRRQACVERTLGLVLRAARRLGEEFVFENAGEELWRQVEQRLGALLADLQAAGALAGRRPGEAFRVRCDRSTMSRQDIDNGRVIVEVAIRPAASIETLCVHLSLNDAGQISLARLGRATA